MTSTAPQDHAEPIIESQTEFYRSAEELAQAEDYVRQSPRESGVLKLVVRRPAENEREVLTSAELDPAVGVVGDNWGSRSSGRTADGGAHPDMQLNIMNARTIEVVAQTQDRWQLAGDQLFVDMDLSEESLPAWTKLAIGSAIIEVTDQPHAGCAKFSRRFGVDAHRWVNSKVGKELKLRGINARVIQAGTIQPGDAVTRLA